MKSYYHLIHFWIPMAVPGSSASAEDTPPPFQNNVVAHGKAPQLVFTIADPKGKMKFPKPGDILKYLKSDR